MTTAGASSASSLRPLLRAAWALALLSIAVRLIPGSAIPVSPLQVICLVAAAAVALPLSRAGGHFNVLLARWRHFSNPMRAGVTVFVWAAASAYLIFTALVHHRYLLPQWDDEQSYLMGARMLARGRLWMPQRPLADFFESFYILVKPVYASVYFPGTALLNVPGVWLRLPIWVLPVTMAGLVVALTYRIVAELLDDLSGLLAALLVVSDTWFADFAMRVMGQVPAALMGLLTIWAWLHWRRAGAAGRAVQSFSDSIPSSAAAARYDGGFRRAAWAMAMGCFAGWGAIIRPFDALAFGLPVAIAVLWELRKRGWRARAVTIAAAIAGILPFAALQITFDAGVTGSPWRTPYALEQQQELPGILPGYRPFDPNARPGSSLVQKQAAYDTYVGEIREHTWTNAPHQLWQRAQSAVRVGIGPWILVLLAPLALMQIGRRGRGVLLAALPLYLLLYLFNPIFLLHYALSLTPVFAFAIVLGAEAVVNVSDRLAWQRFARIFLPLAVAVLTIAVLPEVDSRHQIAARYAAPAAAMEEALRSNVQSPAIVLFLFHNGDELDYEPVYNADVAWPDDDPIIRVHDLGARNRELFTYFAARQPNRRIYRCDEANEKVEYLGTAGELAGVH